MKLDPGFPDHWKTRQLYNLLGAEAVLSVLRLWGRAQISREWQRLELSPKKLKAVCAFPGNEDDLWKAFTDPDCPWLDQDEEGTFSIHGFEEHQAQVIALWRNGKKGGRPSKKPTPPLTHTLPLTPHGSHTVSSFKPNENHLVLDGGGERKESAITPENSPLMIRLGKFLNRKPTTRWDEKERKALKALMPLDTDAVDLVERYYLADIPEEKDIRRKSILTMLNNWNGELDRATLHASSHKS